MPRLRTSLLLRAHAIDPLLPLLLRTCRALPSARNELRWLREHAQTQPSGGSTKTPPPAQWRSNLHHMCVERARGRPLQYILGSQPFGDLSILCKPGVLIPRPETEAHTTHLARLLLLARPPPGRLRILDLCTGSGCIALLLALLLAPHVPSLRLLGLDICPRALRLARQNRQHNMARGHLRASAGAHVAFGAADVLQEEVRGAWDVVVANPPYVAPGAYVRETARSVRNYEPRLALVPLGRAEAGEEEAGDGFYPRLVEVAWGVGARVVLVEVGDMAQAVRVAGMVGGWDGCEIWRDWVDGGTGGEDGGEVVDVDGRRVRVLGEGNGRVVVCWRGEGGGWIGRDEV